MDNVGIKVIKFDKIKDKGVSLIEVDKLQKRYQSAAGQQQSVIGEVFTLLNKAAQRQEHFEQRLIALENK